MGTEFQGETKLAVDAKLAELLANLANAAEAVVNGQFGAEERLNRSVDDITELAQHCKYLLLIDEKIMEIDKVIAEKG